MAEITILRPDHEAPPPETFALAERRAAPANPVIGLIVNGKPLAFELLGMIADELTSALSRPISVEIVRKPSAAIQLEEAEADRIAALADFVVCGLGDCGACSTTSLYDALMFERRGVPATLVITEPFQSIIASTGARLGAPGYHTVTVPHPVFGKTDDELRELARGLAGPVAGQLTGPAQPADSLAHASAQEGSS